MAEQTEFDLIKKYFTPESWRKDVSLGVGDDCALLTPPAGKQLAVTVDTLVSGVHFPVETSPADIAYKSIAVNLSDLAAMGAEPAWVTLALTLPEISDDWLRSFAESFAETLAEYNVQLVGGDTTQGPLAITVQATGFVDSDVVMRRDNAKPGDLIYITGTLGDAALGLKLQSSQAQVDKKTRDHCLNKLNRPVPRVAFAQVAAKYCSCAIDISDGLVADIGHIIAASHCSAEIYIEKVPVSKELKEHFVDSAAANKEIYLAKVLAGGDDYELCMTIPDSRAASLVSLAESMDLPLTCIGKVGSENNNMDHELRIIDADGQLYVPGKPGFEHFG